MPLGRRWEGWICMLSTADHVGLHRYVRCSADEIGHYVLLPGDPGRVAMLASFLEGGRAIAQHRAFTTFSGRLAGVTVSVISTGMGGPAMAIAVEELAALGAHTFIRVGTSGLMQPGMRSGDLVVAAGAIRDEGTALQYLPLSFPAAADPDVVDALCAGCRAMGLRCWVGIAHSKDSLYGEWEPDRMPVAVDLNSNWQAWVRAGALCSEMELATLLIVARMLGKRAGGLIVALADDHPLDDLCASAVRGLQHLIERDRGAAGS